MLKRNIITMMAQIILPVVIDAMANRGRGVDKAEASEISNDVAAQIAPIVANATNNEPWYKSRVYQGLIIAGIGFITARFGGTALDDVDIYNGAVLTVEALGGLLEGAGLLWAAWGRMRTSITLKV